MEEILDGGIDRPGGGVTENAPAMLVFADSGPARNVLNPPLPQTPLDAEARVTASRWFEGMARGDSKADGTMPPSIIGGAQMDVYAQAEATFVASIPVPDDPIFNAEIWQPVELSVLINAAGALTSPVITKGSGVDQIDERLRIVVKQELLPRLRLRPGAYHLVVGP